MADILDVIDGALLDFDTSDDAMRWVPPAKREERPAVDPELLEMLSPESLAAINAAVAGITEFANALGRALNPVFGGIGLAMGKLAKAYANILAEADQAHAREISAMHRAYRQRSKARQRRKR